MCVAPGLAGPCGDKVMSHPGLNDLSVPATCRPYDSHHTRNLRKQKAAFSQNKVLLINFCA
eukprot:scaffold7006_cov174-Skeletonema_marinoi.AAC.44